MKLITTTNYEYLSQFMGLAEGRDWINNIPELTKENVQEVGNAILNLKVARDMFYDELVLKIKEQIFSGLVADNKFKFLKGRNIDGIIEDSYVDYIKGKTFDPEATELLKNVKATIKTLYHKIDRRELYETSISDVQLRTAMLTSNGLGTLLGQVINTLYESQEWDEYTQVKQMIVHNLQYAGKVVYLGDAFELSETETEIVSLTSTLVVENGEGTSTPNIYPFIEEHAIFNNNTAVNFTGTVSNLEDLETLGDSTTGYFIGGSGNYDVDSVVEDGTFVSAGIADGTYTFTLNFEVPKKIYDWNALSDAMLFNLRKMSNNLEYVSREHNILELASRTPKSNQIVVMHKDMNINIDFAKLANIFNLDKVETETNMIEVDNFNDNPYIVGAIMSKDAFRYRDELRITETFRNPQTLTTKYFYHVWQMISYSFLYNTVYFVLGSEESVKDKLGLKTKEELLALTGK